MEDSLDKHIFPSPVDGNHRNEHHSSAVLGLVAAASQGYEECLKMLLKDGADVNACNAPGLTALFIAASNGHDKCVECLIGHGAKVNMPDQQGRTSLMLAVVNGHLACVNLLLEAGANVNSKDKDECTALIFALLTSQDSCANVLIAAGADVNVIYNGRSVLTQAVIKKSRRFVDKLIAAGADVNAVDSNGNSVLIHSVYARDDEYCVNALVQAGADVNYCHGGITVLMAAAIQGHINCVRALIKAGADVNGKDNNRNTNHRNNVERVTYGVSDGEEEMDATPLILTARCVKPRCMEALIEAGADVNLTNEEGCTALLVASNSKGNLKDIYTCMKLLIDAKADVNAIDKNDNTALLFTVSKAQNISEEDAESAHENCRAIKQ